MYINKVIKTIEKLIGKKMSYLEYVKEVNKAFEGYPQDGVKGARL